MKIIKVDSYIYFQASQAIALDLGAVYVQSVKGWKIPCNVDTLQEILKFGLDETTKKTLTELLTNKIQKQKSLVQMKNIEDCSGESRLRPYQRVDVNYLLNIGSGGIFNEQRTGKSPTLLCTLKEHDYAFNLIVCPASKIYEWEQEVENWVEDSRVFVSKGAKQKREQIYCVLKETFMKGTEILERIYLIISYETLRNDVERLEQIMKPIKHTCTMSLDEGHRLNNHRSKTSVVLYKLGRLTALRYVLTGTPVQNHPADIFGIYKFLYPTIFSSYWGFVERYFKVFEAPWGAKEIGKIKRKQELENIMAVTSVSRKRKDVMQWLPPVQHITVPLDMESKQKKAHEAVFKFYEYSENGEVLIDAQNDFVRLMRLNQLCLHPELVGVKAKSPKEEYLLEWLEDNPNESVIIFSCFSSYLADLHEKLKKKYKVDLLTGSTKDKQAVQDAFQAGDVKVLLANIVSAGEGLTLDRGETIIFLDKHFNPAKNEQAQDRIIPVSEERNHACTVISLVMRGSIDEKIQKLLDYKISITDAVAQAGIKGLENLIKKYQEGENANISI